MADCYNPTPAAQRLISDYWPESKSSIVSRDAKAAFQDRMNRLQIELIKLYRPIMSDEDSARARQTLADLRERVAA